MRVLLIIFILFGVPFSWAKTEHQIDLQTKQVPIVKSKSDLPKLVKKLTMNLKTDKEKAYALLTWIVRNIDYDDYKMRQIDKNASSYLSHKEVPSGQDILKTRLGVCADIADLYDKMLALADMHSIVLSGCAGDKIVVNKTSSKCVGVPHSWNAVWIDDQWELVDPTWAITGGEKSEMKNVNYKNAYDRALEKRTRPNSPIYEARSDRFVDDRWFMTDPKVMEQDHYPTKPNSKWLLTSSKNRKNKRLK